MVRGPLPEPGDVAGVAVASADDAPRRRMRPRTAFLVTLAATLLTQCAWIFALPAFHGIDEFDHAYKAAAVAHGQMLPSGRWPKHGRGQVLSVPADLVVAAGDVCRSYTYTGRDNCRAMTAPVDGMVDVSSGAATYNPAFYAVAGTLARPFHGAAFDYALRVVSALVCALLLAWGAAVTARWSRDSWPMLAFGFAATPVLIYSSTVAAPNGVEYAAALLAWTSGIALARTSEGWPLVPFTLAACLMPAMHSTGAVWLAVMVCVLLVLRPPRDWWAILVQQRKRYLTAAVVVAAVGAACLAWILAAHTNTPDEAGVQASDGPSADRLLLQNILWILQALAAFPMRDQSAPGVVYVALLLPLVTLLVLGWRAADTRTRSALLLLLGATIAIPTVATIVTFEELGTSWQGRYDLPLYVGLPLLAAHALTGVRPLRRHHRMALLGLLALASSVSVAHVARDVVVTRPGTSAAEAVPGGWLIVGLLAAAAALLPLPVLLHAGSEDGPEPDVDATTTALSAEPAPALS